LGVQTRNASKIVGMTSALSHLKLSCQLQIQMIQSPFDPKFGELGVTNIDQTYIFETRIFGLSEFQLVEWCGQNSQTEKQTYRIGTAESMIRERSSKNRLALFSQSLISCLPLIR